MRVLLETCHPCHSSARIEQALSRYAPIGVTVVPANSIGYRHSVTPAERTSDLVLLHVGGRRTQVQNRIARLKSAGIDYAVLQLVLRATAHPDTGDWLDIWRDAKFVWSYYDLARLVHEDGHDATGINFYCSALGVDPMFEFPPSGRLRHYTALAEGDSEQRDSLKQIQRAVRRAGGRMVHLGPRMLEGRKVETRTHISNAELVKLYGETQWVAAMRTVEGFEMCAAEGLMCGARPILFDRQEHRDWFGGLAEYIPEDSTDLMVNWLIELFKEGPRPVTEAERDEAAARFSWRDIAGGFWRHATGE